MKHPDVRRSDTMATFVSMRYVPDAKSGAAAVNDIAEQWRRNPRPASILSLNCYLDVAENTVLTYVQCAGPEAYRPFASSLNGVAGGAAVEYRLYRSVVTRSDLVPPGCVVIATFDVDGPDRQQLISDRIADSLEAMPADQYDGMLSANFHASVDGTRVLNYAEWCTDEAHIAFLAGSSRAETFRISSEAPGVRPIGFKRFRQLVGIS